MALEIVRGPGEEIWINPEDPTKKVVIKFGPASGRTLVYVDAPDGVSIYRRELWERIQKGTPRPPRKKRDPNANR